jgi:hypothetical protein
VRKSTVVERDAPSRKAERCDCNESALVDFIGAKLPFKICLPYSETELSKQVWLARTPSSKKMPPSDGGLVLEGFSFYGIPKSVGGC